ncbi:MAG: MBL fold metallo-hydrolase [Actinomycetota bacterium]|nr:MBL fold metallo-hydrolase [Actinomycetota bacterium]MDD5666278.1 MBL fold metallo-hydrolase [Actinomycetota bacterium]
MGEIIRIAGLIENCYLVRRESPYLVDTLNPKAYKRLSEGLRENGVDPRDLAHILITHYHYDHTGNLAELKRLSWAEVIAGAGDVPFIEGERPPQTGSDLNRTGRLLGRLPASLTTSYQRCAAAQVDVSLKGGETLEELGLEAVALPGHTPGGMCFLDRANRRAFVGDIVSNYFGRVGLPVLSASYSLEEIEESMRRLAALELEHMYPGHGRIIGPGASGLVAAFVRKKFG